MPTSREIGGASGNARDWICVFFKETMDVLVHVE